MPGQEQKERMLFYLAEKGKGEDPALEELATVVNTGDATAIANHIQETGLDLETAMEEAEQMGPLNSTAEVAIRTQLDQ